MTSHEREPHGLPRWAERMLAALTPAVLHDAVLGDLTERYARVRSDSGAWRARLWLWTELVRCRPVALRLEARRARLVEGRGNRRRRGMAAWWLDLLARDAKQGARSMVRAPAFTAAAVLTLGLGTGAATAVFSLVHGVVLRPLAFRDPERLVMLWETNREKQLHREPLSPVNFLDYR
jgi:hypothetical protein